MAERDICCFTGHRSIDSCDIDLLRDRLDKTLDKLISIGVTHFRTGGALGFDTLAALMVLEKKEQNDNVFLELCIPCEDQTRGWSENAVRYYEYIKSRADKITCLHKTYVRGCMHERNRYMVDGSKYCIAYCKKSSGGTYYTVQYAESHSVKVINLLSLKRK